eukprot:5530535-Pyramimonas_sp.AAC.1
MPREAYRNPMGFLRIPNESHGIPKGFLRDPKEFYGIPMGILWESYRIPEEAYRNPTEACIPRNPRNPWESYGILTNAKESLGILGNP